MGIGLNIQTDNKDICEIMVKDFVEYVIKKSLKQEISKSIVKNVQENKIWNGIKQEINAERQKCENILDNIIIKKRQILHFIWKEIKLDVMPISFLETKFLKEMDLNVLNVVLKKNYNFIIKIILTILTISSHFVEIVIKNKFLKRLIDNRGEVLWE